MKAGRVLRRKGLVLLTLEPVSYRGVGGNLMEMWRCLVLDDAEPPSKSIYELPSQPGSVAAWTVEPPEWASADRFEEVT